ncbi:MAG: 50S ribosomal protein L11 methyltransferase [Chitinophagaceae bacterium]
MTTSNYIEIAINCDSPENLEIIMARLIELGYEGFSEDGLNLIGYIPEQEFNKELLQIALAEWGGNYQVAVVANRNWNAEWESSFDPVRVGNFCQVRAHFHEAGTAVKYDLVITPKMSFGTGHHATTYLMLEALEQEEPARKMVLDFGTGTGVLAILAEKMGAAFVSAIDNDEWSINNGIENLERNHCTKIELQLRDSLEKDKKFHFVLANINRNVIIDNMADLAGSLQTGGVLLLSGFLVADQPTIQKAVEAAGLKMSGCKERNGWSLIRAVL